MLFDRKIYIFLFIYDNKTLNIIHLQHVLSFIHFIKRRYPFEINVIIFALTNICSHIKAHLNAKTNQPIDDWSVVAINHVDCMITHANQIKHSILNKHHFEYIFLLRSNHDFHESFYTDFKLWKHQLTFSSSHDTKQNHLGFVSIPYDIALTLTYLPFTRQALDYTQVSYACMNRSITIGNHMPEIESEIHVLSKTNTKKIWIHIHTEHVSNWIRMWSICIQKYHEHANIIVSFHHGSITDGQYKNIPCLFVKVYTRHTPLIHYQVLQHIHNYNNTFTHVFFFLPTHRLLSYKQFQNIIDYVESDKELYLLLCDNGNKSNTNTKTQKLSYKTTTQHLDGFLVTQKKVFEYLSAVSTLISTKNSIDSSTWDTIWIRSCEQQFEDVYALRDHKITKAFWFAQNKQTSILPKHEQNTINLSVHDKKVVKTMMCMY